MSGASWLIEGTAWRTPVQRFPIVHLLVADTEELWCTGTKGRPDNPVRGVGERICKTCQQLALDAIEDETLSPEDVGRFLPGDPTAVCAEDGCGHTREEHNGKGGRCSSGKQKNTAAWRCDCRQFVREDPLTADEWQLAQAALRKKDVPE